MGNGASCVRRPDYSDEVYLLLRQWIPEYITVYADLGEKHHCAYTEFIGGLIEYAQRVKHYGFPNEMRMGTLIWMTDTILEAIYPKTITKKGTWGASGSHDMYHYLTGIRMKAMP